MNKITKFTLGLMAALLLAIPTVQAAGLILNYQTIQMDAIPRGTSQSAVLNVFNNSLGATVVGLSISQDPIWDPTGGTNLVWLRSSQLTAVALSAYTNANALSSTNFTLTANTSGWSVTNQYATAVLTITNTAGYTYTVPVVASTTGVYSPITTNRFLNVDGTTNVVIVIQRSNGAPYINWYPNNH